MHIVTVITISLRESITVVAMTLSTVLSNMLCYLDTIMTWRSFFDVFMHKHRGCSLLLAMYCATDNNKNCGMREDGGVTRGGAVNPPALLQTKPAK